MLEKDEIMPMMEKMMKSLLSKDLLYPAIKDLSDKYPEWLAENRSKLTEPEYEKYNKQFDISLQITKVNNWINHNVEFLSDHYFHTCVRPHPSKYQKKTN